MNEPTKMPLSHTDSRDIRLNTLRTPALVCLAASLVVLDSCAGLKTQTGDGPEINHTFQVRFTTSRIRLLKEYAEHHYAGFYQEKYGSPGFPGLEIDPKVIVLHYTAGSTLRSAFKTFGPEMLGGRPELEGAGAVNVGIQFIVDYDGTIYQIQPDNYFARHCIGLNHSAIGIENIGRGDITPAGLAGEPQNDDLLTEKQLKSNAHLIRYLKSKYPEIEILIGHSEYRQLEDPSHPGYQFFYESDPEYRTEKSDPGPNFMRALREELDDLLRAGTNGQVFRDASERGSRF